MSDVRDVRVVRGEPTDEELAALVAAFQFAVITSAHRGPGSGPGAWVASARPRFGRLPRPGRDAWRTSALPRL